MFASSRAGGGREAPHDVRSNPGARSTGPGGWIASSQGLLAMTADSALVPLEQRVDILAEPDHGAGAHVLVGLAVQIFCRAAHDLHGEAGLRRRLEQRQVVKVVI